MNKTTAALAAAGFALSGLGGMLSAQATSASTVHLSTHADATCATRTVATRTNLVLAKHFVHRGDANSGTVHVRSDGAVNPRGTIEVAIYQSQSGMGFDETLNNGVVSFPLPRRLSVGTYSVRATYVPEQCSRWKRSLSSVEQLTVLAN